jgi:hypothetical protein
MIGSVLDTEQKKGAAAFLASVGDGFLGLVSPRKKTSKTSASTASGDHAAAAKLAFESEADASSESTEGIAEQLRSSVTIAPAKFAGARSATPWGKLFAKK